MADLRGAGPRLCTVPVVRVLALVARLCSPACSSELLSPFPLLVSLTSHAQPFSHMTESCLRHSPVSSAPALVTSSILHIFIKMPVPAGSAQCLS